jgi:hypothetical protein
MEKLLIAFLGFGLPLFLFAGSSRLFDRNNK